jgi:hypothetical protein
MIGLGHITCTESLLFAEFSLQRQAPDELPLECAAGASLVRLRTVAFRPLPMVQVALLLSQWTVQLCCPAQSRLSVPLRLYEQPPGTSPPLQFPVPFPYVAIITPSIGLSKWFGHCSTAVDTQPPGPQSAVDAGGTSAKHDLYGGAGGGGKYQRMPMVPRLPQEEPFEYTVYCSQAAG